MYITYKSINELTKLAEKSNKKLSSIILEEQSITQERSQDDIFNEMKYNFQVMKEAIKSGLNPNLKSVSGLTGGDSSKIKNRIQSGKSLIGSDFSYAIMRAIATSENNAAMGKIVAAPTAGSCGIIPAAIITLQKNRSLTDNECIMSLFTASAMGLVIAENASVSGAKGGCQAECGSASAMAAAALVELDNGTPSMIENSVAIALKNQLGLVCDPVAGLVEIPCIKRNAAGVANAFVAAELALSGVESKIPVDQVVSAMKSVGDALPSSLKETAEGGLAATKKAIELRKRVFGDK